MRDTTQLPSTDELNDIIRFESKRDVLTEKFDTHYPSFESLIKLLEKFHLETEFVRTDYSQDEWIKDNCQEQADTLIKKLIDAILHTSSADRGIFDDIYDYLSEEDELSNADVIFVFGAKTPLRAEKAVDLYKIGWSKKIIFSGHGPYTGRTEITEAQKYKKIAIDAGVSQNDILLETESITIPDNVRGSLNKFDEIGFIPKKLIVVNSPYVQRRGWCHFQKYLPKGVEVIRQNCSTKEEFSRDGWFTNPEGIKVVLNEFFKMKIAVILNTA